VCRRLRMRLCVHYCAGVESSFYVNEVAKWI